MLHICTECGEPAEQYAPNKWHALCAKCRENRLIKTKDSICWDCKHSVPDKIGLRGCAWSMYKMPVKGWVAEETKLKIAEGDYRTSYYVKECPEYAKG